MEVAVIALDRQVHVYSVDTKAFYTDKEMELNRSIDAMRYERKKIKKIVGIWDQYRSSKITGKKMSRLLRDAKYDGDPLTVEIVDTLKQRSKDLIEPINQTKRELLDELNRFSGTRTFRPEFLRGKNIISIFESELTRMIGVETDTLTQELLVVKTCYFKVLEDIVLNGFLLDGEQYECLTASAGQIRTKRSVFIRSSTLKRITPRLYCGLTVEHINELGGINTNKYLAYLALCNSATDVWEGFDIRKTIVVDDMETEVVSLVDYIDDKTYEIERKTMPVPITHTDGAGMVRLDVSRKNFMLRLPFVKGLVAAFPFDKFIREQNRADPSKNHGIVKDIYGVEHDVLAEDIQVILTKSQFKMHKYVPNWETYCDNFERYGCQACYCNMEPPRFEKAKINYQMLQTLTDLTDEELLELSAETRRRITGVATDRNIMLKMFGATPDNPRRNGFQEALLTYPELLQDEYCKETLREIKNSIEKEAKAGKLDVDGVYTFIVPDMYAFCQWLFLGDRNPAGLLQNGEVHCPLFGAEEELDCLRSPHLYVEHAVRVNKARTGPELKRWFVTNAIVTSVHDVISKILQFDCDGDKALVVRDPVLVEAAKRNTKDIVPLYYVMAKAGAHPLSRQAIYDSMTLAYTGGNIGQISNNISIIWNSAAQDNRLEVVKLLCMENNFVIDQIGPPVRQRAGAHLVNLDIQGV